MASYILQRKLPRRVYREIGGIRALLENITPRTRSRTLNSPMLPCRLRVRVQDSNGCRERPRLRPEKSHFLSFHRFSLLHPSLLYFTDVHPFRPTLPPTFRLLVDFFLSPLFSVKTCAFAPLLIKRNVVGVNICGGKRNRREKKKNATSKGRFLRLCVSLFIDRETGKRPGETSNRAELLTGISGSILERSVCRGEAC